MRPWLVSLVMMILIAATLALGAVLLFVWLTR